ncbi:hypothetical protein KUCAC02_015649 [Chaenocephalus aceratus]|uniref:Uncharacterized protein n=1 Tax=Chaenocephalus aceratus TaxID=36190 RepID=A0ACB9XZP0_CHAAC|nr:hypothetical protein KUCAC02_015649 [Chaenocephalus aceratus]
MQGPYRVVDIEGKVAEIVSEKGNNTMKVNIDHLTRYVQPEERIPAKLKKLLDPSPLADPLTSTPTSTSTSTPSTSTSTPSTSSQTLAPSSQAEGASSEVETCNNPRHMGREEEGDSMGQVWPIQSLQREPHGLGPGQQLEGEIINAYLSWVGIKAGAFIFDSYLITSLWQGTHKGGLRKLDLTKHNVAAGAVCHRAHWTLIIMYLRENRSLFLDPFWGHQRPDKPLQRPNTIAGPQDKPSCWEMGMRQHGSSQTAGHNIMRCVDLQACRANTIGPEGPVPC